jgi:hypothetical protein
VPSGDRNAFRFRHHQLNQTTIEVDRLHPYFENCATGDYQGTGSVTFQPLGLFFPYDIHQASRNYDIWDPLRLYIFETSYLLRIVNLPHLCAQTSRVKVVSQARGLHRTNSKFPRHSRDVRFGANQRPLSLKTTP